MDLPRTNCTHLPSGRAGDVGKVTNSVLTLERPLTQSPVAPLSHLEDTRPDKWVENWLDFPTGRGAEQSPAGYPSQVNTESILFNDFNNNLGDGMCSQQLDDGFQIGGNGRWAGGRAGITATLTRGRNRLAGTSGQSTRANAKSCPWDSLARLEIPVPPCA